jgi:hypothetical protein
MSPRRRVSMPMPPAGLLFFGFGLRLFEGAGNPSNHASALFPILLPCHLARLGSCGADLAEFREELWTDETAVLRSGEKQDAVAEGAAASNLGKGSR